MQSFLTLPISTGSPYAKLFGKKKSNGEGKQGKQVARHNGSSPRKWENGVGGKQAVALIGFNMRVTFFKIAFFPLHANTSKMARDNRCWRRCYPKLTCISGWPLLLFRDRERLVAREFPQPKYDRAHLGLSEAGNHERWPHKHKGGSNWTLGKSMGKHAPENAAIKSETNKAPPYWDCTPWRGEWIFGGQPSLPC